MAILENRVKKYSRRSRNRYLGSASFSAIPAINFLAGLVILILAFNPSFLSINKYLVDLNGGIYTKVINPTKSFFENSINLVINIANFNNLHLENLYLKTLNNKLAQQVHAALHLHQENIKLMKALNLANPEELSRLKAKLIFKSSSESGYLAVIAAGKNNGVKNDNIVLTNGYLAGRIVTVGENYSKVSLVNSYNSRIPVKTNNTGLKAILVGGADKGGYLLHLHGGQKPQEGELIVTSGDGSFYPKDIPVARIEKITNDNVIVSIFSDLSTTDFIDIIDPNNFDN